MNIKRIVRAPQVEQVRQLTYSTDGKENMNPAVRGAKVRSTSRLEQGQLLIDGRDTIDVPAGKVERSLSERWTVSTDGRTLTIESSATPQGLDTRRHTEVYLRKPRLPA